MSRTGWSEDGDYDQWQVIMAQGALASAIRGKRGQAFLRELADALDAMPDKRLADGLLTAPDGCHCALGVLGEKRGLDLQALQPEDPDDDWNQHQIAQVFGVSETLAKQVQWINDESCIVRPMDSTEVIENRQRQRWGYVRDWVARNLKVVAHG